MKRVILTVILPLTLGTLIYLLFRTDTLRVFSWLDTIGLKTTVENIRHTNLISYIKPNNLIKYSFSDGLWIFSYCSAILILWDNKVTTKNIFWLALLPAIGIITEIAQFFGLLNGTFDIADVLCYIAGFLFPIILFSKKAIKKQYESWH